MSNFRLLLKTNIINTFGLNKLSKKSENRKISIWMILLIFIGVIFSFGISFMYLMMFGSAFSNAGLPELVLSIGLFAGVFFTFLVTLTNANGYLFHTRDFDLLMSLPVKSTTIVASKLTFLILINYATFAILYLPTLVVYEIFNQTNVMFWILAVITFFLIPMLPITVSSILAFGFGLIAPRFKHKNIVTIILTLLLIFFIMYLSFQSSIIETNPNKFTSDMRDFLNKTGQLAFEGIRGDYKQFLFFTLLSIIPFVIFIFLVGENYLYANTCGKASYTKKNFKITSLKTTSQNKALILKELKRYFGSYIYVVNTIVGPILSTIFLLIFYFSPNEFLKDIGLSMGENSPLGMILTAMFVFTLGITSTTASSISIEGRQFWILKSAPIRPKQIFIAKVFVNLIITIPFNIINVILTYLIFPINVVDVIFMLIIPTLFVIYMSYAGLYFNILMPRFDYDSDVKAVKQSMSVLITMFVGMVLALGIIGLGVLGVDQFNNNLYGYLLATAGSTLLAILSITLVNTHGIKKFNRLNG